MRRNRPRQGIYSCTTKHQGNPLCTSLLCGSDFIANQNPPKHLSNNEMIYQNSNHITQILFPLNFQRKFTGWFLIVNTVSVISDFLEKSGSLLAPESSEIPADDAYNYPPNIYKICYSLSRITIREREREI